MEDFDISKITMSKVYLDEYKVNPYSEELTYTLVNCDGDDSGGSRVLRFADDGTWSLCDKDAAIVRKHIFLESWNGDRILNAIFYDEHIAAVKIHDDWIPLSGWGNSCICFRMGVECARNNQ